MRSLPQQGPLSHADELKEVHSKYERLIRAGLEAANQWKKRAQAAEGQLEALETKVVEQRSALIQFGYHHKRCDIHADDTHGDDSCSCGYSKACQ